MKQYFARYLLVAFVAILLVAGSTRVLARAGGPAGLADIFQASSDDLATETVDPTETAEPTGTAGPTDTPEPSETPGPGDDDETEFTGTVEQISADVWVVSRQDEQRVDASALRADEGRDIAAISVGEPRVGIDPTISEWGNPLACGLGPSVTEGTGGTETSHVPRGTESIPVVAASEPGAA